MCRVFHLYCPQCYSSLGLGWLECHKYRYFVANVYPSACPAADRAGLPDRPPIAEPTAPAQKPCSACCGASLGSSGHGRSHTSVEQSSASQSDKGQLSGGQSSKDKPSAGRSKPQRFSGKDKSSFGWKSLLRLRTQRSFEKDKSSTEWKSLLKMHQDALDKWGGPMYG